jgi:glycosyltransferase involved in cell wall biosynthesis
MRAKARDYMLGLEFFFEYVVAGFSLFSLRSKLTRDQNVRAKTLQNRSNAPAILRGGVNAPRVLYVTPYWPHRGSCASELRALHIGRALQDIGRVEMVVVDAEGGEEEWADLLDQEFKIACSVRVEDRPKKVFGQKLNWMFNPRITYPHGCGVGADALQRVLQIADGVDLTWFCKLRTPNMFPRWSWERSVADIDDVPSTFEQSAFRSAKGLRAHLLATMRHRSWQHRERLLGERFSVLGVCSELDKRYLQSLGVQAPMHVIPNGFELPDRLMQRSPATPARFGFIGIFDYPPNLDGIQWFARECWPRVKHAMPEARLRLVGRYSDGPLKPSGQDIDGLGFVPDVDEEIASWSAMIVPIRLGAGTRGKIAHAFSLKCPVVSTFHGAYGYEAHDGLEMMLADSPEDFAIACIKAAQDPVEASAMAERAWVQFLEKWSWDAIRPRVWQAAQDCLRLNAKAGGNVKS